MMKCLAKTRCKDIEMPHIDMHSCTYSAILGHCMHKMIKNVVLVQEIMSMHGISPNPSPYKTTTIFHLKLGLGSHGTMILCWGTYYHFGYL